MRKLKLVGCSDPMMWYAGLVGQLVPLLREENDVYLSREPEGYTNIVRKRDAKVVWVDLEGREFGDGDTARCACKAIAVKLSNSVTRSHPTEPMPLGTTHNVLRCTFSPEAIGTNVHMPMTDQDLANQSLGWLMKYIGNALSYGRALLGKGTKGQ